MLVYTVDIMKHKATKVDFGRIALLRQYCPLCKREALVIDGKMACCGVVTENPGEYRAKREVDTEKRRKHISRRQKAKIVETQGNKCYYCGTAFGSAVWTPKKGIVILTPVFDHVVCWAFSGDSRVSNMAASCRICNSIKSSYLFENKEDAVRYIKSTWEKKGYEVKNNDAQP